jgi:hypothetical protein
LGFPNGSFETSPNTLTFESEQDSLARELNPDPSEGLDEEEEDSRARTRARSQH